MCISENTRCLTAVLSPKCPYIIAESILEKAVHTLLRDRMSQDIKAVGNTGAIVPEQVYVRGLIHGITFSGHHTSPHPFTINITDKGVEKVWEQVIKKACASCLELCLRRSSKVWNMKRSDNLHGDSLCIISRVSGQSINTLNNATFQALQNTSLSYLF